MLFKEAYIWAQMRKGEIPDIYVQSMKYWEQFQNEIKQRFSSGIGLDHRVALHIRRGDYLKVSQFHINLWDTDYYQKAVALFPKGTKFLVFCKDNQNEAQDADDQEWCLNNLPQLGIDFDMHTHTAETEDLNHMASCMGLIGANSSFSWWGAFLMAYPHAQIVFPKTWFCDGLQRTELLDKWTQI